MLNKIDFELKEIKTENNHIDYYFICSDNAQEEFKNYYEDILIQKVIFSEDENIVIMECNDNGYIYNTLCSNDKLVKNLIKIFSNFANQNNKKEVNKNAVENAITAMERLAKTMELFESEYEITDCADDEDDDLIPEIKKSQISLEDYIKKTTRPFPKLIKTPP